LVNFLRRCKSEVNRILEDVLVHHVFTKLHRWDILFHFLRRLEDVFHLRRPSQSQELLHALVCREVLSQVDFSDLRKVRLVALAMFCELEDFLEGVSGHMVVELEASDFASDDVEVTCDRLPLLELGFHMGLQLVHFSTEVSVLHHQHLFKVLPSLGVLWDGELWHLVDLHLFGQVTKVDGLFTVDMLAQLFVVHHAQHFEGLLHELRRSKFSSRNW